MNIISPLKKKNSLIFFFPWSYKKGQHFTHFELLQLRCEDMHLLPTMVRGGLTLLSGTCTVTGNPAPSLLILPFLFRTRVVGDLCLFSPHADR